MRSTPLYTWTTLTPVQRRYVTGLTRERQRRRSRRRRTAILAIALLMLLVGLVIWWYVGSIPATWLPTSAWW